MIQYFGTSECRFCFILQITFIAVLTRGHSLTEFCLSVVLLPTLCFIVRNAAKSGTKNNVRRGSTLSCGCCQEMGIQILHMWHH
jgi:hypothetical protein